MAAGAAAGPLLLDTHAWIWWVAGSNEVPVPLRKRIQVAYAASNLWVSAISAWEAALLTKRGRLSLRLPLREWLAQNEALPGLHLLPVDPRIGVRSVELQGLHADPADRMIVASAERLGAILVTRDERLRAYTGIPTLWS